MSRIRKKIFSYVFVLLLSIIIVILLPKVFPNNFSVQATDYIYPITYPTFRTHNNPDDMLTCDGSTTTTFAGYYTYDYFGASVPDIPREGILTYSVCGKGSGSIRFGKDGNNFTVFNALPGVEYCYQMQNSALQEMLDVLYNVNNNYMYAGLFGAMDTEASLDCVYIKLTTVDPLPQPTPVPTYISPLVRSTFSSFNHPEDMLVCDGSTTTTLIQASHDYFYAAVPTVDRNSIVAYDVCVRGSGYVAAGFNNEHLLVFNATPGKEYCYHVLDPWDLSYFLNNLYDPEGYEGYYGIWSANASLDCAYIKLTTTGPAYNTPVGTNIVVQPVDSTTNQAPISVTFDVVSQAGDTTLTTSSNGQPPPSGFRLGTPPVYYDLQTTAVFNEAEVCIDYSGTSLDSGKPKENNLKLFHQENGTWVERTVSLDTATNIICASVTSFFQLAIFEPNSPPEAGQITAPTLSQVNSLVEVSAPFTDPDTTDHHQAIWNWGDGATSEGVVNEENGSGAVTGNHTYATPGVYSIKLTVTDEFNLSAESLFEYLVIYDPEGSFVTGGGWFNSLPGAYTADSALTGKASFGFVSKYEHGANVPTGQTEFQFKVADLNFHSTSYDWLVVAGANAKYKGTGSINGTGDYGFMLTAKDAQITGNGSDSFRIKIWDKANGQVIYDNQPDNPDDAEATTVLGGGSIVIHK